MSAGIRRTVRLCRMMAASLDWCTFGTAVRPAPIIAGPDGRSRERGGRPMTSTTVQLSREELQRLLDLLKQVEASLKAERMSLEAAKVARSRRKLEADDGR
jgi:hypothetical protein